ncbi:MAG TPA: DNA-3-methyladenine glycosylase [Candidatus Dormibacteraeota bacterium]|nr:DNA-3-methyladenine glycosylase [Candidatus Dormibacteraeota bacterium]
MPDAPFEAEIAVSGGRVPLARGFFSRPSPVVAQALLGCYLVRLLHDQEIRVLITETEAYLGTSDPASHAFRGRTSRNAPMFGEAGFAYVYFIYGMHHCLNVVTGMSGDPQAVLFRGAVEMGEGGELRLEGPALLCCTLEIDLACNGLDLCRPGVGAIWFEAGPDAPWCHEVTPRVGVRDPSLLRFVAKGRAATSRTRTNKKERAPQGSLRKYAVPKAPVPTDQPEQETS